MKILKSFILGSMLLFCGSTIACGPFYYSSIDYRIYRIHPSEIPTSSDPRNHFIEENIKLWSRQTGCKDKYAIREAIYSGTLADWEALYRDSEPGAKVQEWFQKNAFVNHLWNTNDSAAIEVLYLSKLYESIRNQQRSPWYYNSHLGTDETRLMEDLWQEVRGMLKKRDKYAVRRQFLAIKCAWAAEHDDDVIRLWQRYESAMKLTIFYDEAEDYLMRSYERKGDLGKLNELRVRCNRWEDLIPSNAPVYKQLRLMLQLRPNAEQIAVRLQGFLTALDYDQASEWRDDKDYMEKTDSVLVVVNEALRNPQVRNKAMWRYAAACMLDYKGCPQQALQVLQTDTDSSGSTFLRKSTRILTFYLRAKIEPINDSFESYAIGEMRWLDREMKREWRALPDNMKYHIAHLSLARWSFDYHLRNYMYAYCAMNRIVLADSTGLAWRMAEAGRGVRALQMANMADNSIVKLTDNQVVQHLRTSTDSILWGYYESPEGTYHYLNLTSLDDTTNIDGKIWWMIYEDRFNHHDYSCPFFCVVDDQSARTLEDYYRRVLHPINDDDRWFNAHGYTDNEYWHDIIGTHHLRECNYRAAIKHFQRLSDTYQRLTNLSCWLDPFCVDFSIASHDSTRYKLHFAQRMDSLQHAMHHGSDADSRGLAMLEYTIGLENSFGNCWWLTSYSRGWNGSGLTDVEDTRYAQRANATCKKLRDKAFRTLRTNDARARYYARLGKIWTLRAKYPRTMTAQYYELVCDSRELYHTQPWQNLCKKPLW